MANTIIIEIKGLAFCYFQDSLWNVYFISEKVNPAHKIKLTYPGQPAPVPRELYGSAEIKFEIGGAGAEPLDPQGVSFPVIFNVQKDAHTKNKVEWKTGPPSSKYNFIKMTVPGAQLETRRPTDLNYYVIEIKNGTAGSPKKLRPVAEIVGARIELKDGGTLALKIDDQNVALNLGLANPFKISFDNDCNLRDPNCVDDWEAYYHLIQDKKEKGKLKYRTTRARVTKTGKVMLSPDGNCDPYTSDPPPG